VFTRQFDGLAAERHSNSFVGAEVSRLHAIVGCLKRLISRKSCCSEEVEIAEELTTVGVAAVVVRWFGFRATHTHDNRLFT